ncbi:hypothetical protein CMI47_17915 [Candidatus Pacearchaeota archaeon]|jgi:hypothetical protein|nr:hypothetical protein [Candidatus Pacearchaeota archaeon]|tara:strand:+ start:364 stop:1182 length:819 start_codon:yes stop_codon:yes gene_type:complete
MPYAKICIAGHSGSGKTFTAAKAPYPFFLLFEPQGELSAKAGSAAAGEEPTHVGVRRCSLDLEGLQSSLDFIHKLDNPSSENLPLDPRTTIVIDSLSAVQQACMREIAKSKASKRVNHGLIRALNQDDWDLANRWLLHWLDQVLAVDYNVIVLVHARRPERKSGGKIVLEPRLEGQRINDFLHQRFTAVGMLHRIFDRATQTTQRVVVFDPVAEVDGRICLGKPGPGLRPVEHAEPAWWIETMQLAMTGQPSPHPAPDLRPPLPASSPVRLA